ncbi:MAG: 50S ribosomal protein L1 [Candidatus Nomurabacteria bacterium]|nr:MAG: 50S ribosomal protein L1 [Candidatus Nomurabacteria bacterium]
MSSRSKRYNANNEKIEAAKLYTIDEALQLIKSQASTKFDEGVELHFRLGIDAKKADQIVRGTVQLPHGTGKTLKVAAFVPANMVEEVKAAGADVVGGEELVKEIKTTNKTNFDVAVAHPTLMKALGPIAKTLGQKGLMPNPRNETVTANPAEAVKALKKGKATFRSDTTGNVHQLVGRVSFADAQLRENIDAFVDAVRRAKPSEAKGTFMKSVTLSSSMGPGIKVSLD